MKGKYVIKTLNSEKDEYLCYSSVVGGFYLDTRHCADVYQSIEEARKYLTVPCLVESKFKCGIYKLVESLQFVEGILY